MRVFITGATGFIGSAVVRELIAAGHQVSGLARSPDKAKALAASGADVVMGSLEDLDGVKRAAAAADGVIHLAFNHDFSKFVENCEDDRRVIAALGSVLDGSDRPLIVTSGTLIANSAPGRSATEEDEALTSGAHPRAASEQAARALSETGVNVSVVRLPQVHDTTRQGLITFAIAMAIEKGVCPYVGDGQNRWPSAHVLDTARLYRLALEKAESGARYHAVAEEGVCLRDIAEALGRQLKLPAGRSIRSRRKLISVGWRHLSVSMRRPPAHSRERACNGTRRSVGCLPISESCNASTAEAVAVAIDERRPSRKQKAALTVSRFGLRRRRSPVSREDRSPGDGRGRSGVGFQVDGHLD